MIPFSTQYCTTTGLKPGDTIIVTKLDRIARSISKGSELIESLIEKGINYDGMQQDIQCTVYLANIDYIYGTELEQQLINNGYIFKTDLTLIGSDGWYRLIEDGWFNINAADRLIDEINDSRVKICLDIGHVNCNSNMSLEDWIKTLNTRVAQYHFHNNHGKQTIYGYNGDDEHLAINDGTIDIEKTLKLAEEYTPNAIWSIESKVKFLEESVEVLRKLGYIN